jgi:hypothetical protein
VERGFKGQKAEAMHKKGREGRGGKSRKGERFLVEMKESGG